MLLISITTNCVQQSFFTKYLEREVDDIRLYVEIMVSVPLMLKYSAQL